MDYFKTFEQDLFGSHLHFREHYFNLASLGGAGATVFATIASAVSIKRVALDRGMGFWELGLPGMCVCISLLIFFILSFFIYRITKNLDFSIILCLVGLNFILFPALFVTVGGISSGMPIYFVMGLIFTVLMLSGRSMFIMLALESLWYILVFYFSAKYADYIRYTFFEMPEWAMYLDQAMDFFVVGLATSVLVKMLASRYEAQQEQTNELLDKLEELSVKDPLSGAYNRRFLLRYIEQGIEKYRESGAPFSIIMFDIDKFKRVNDDFGHLAGDDIIKGFSEVMISSCRDYDVVARYGGEEFILAMPGASEDIAFDRAEQIRQKVESSRFTEAIDRPVTVSGGVAAFNSSMRSVEEFIALADENLYIAKESGRNRIVRKG